MNVSLHFRLPLLLAFGLLVATTSLKAADAERDPRGEFKAITGEYEQARTAYSKAYSAAKTDAEREQAGSKYPQPDKYAKRLLQLAKDHPKDAAALDSLTWIVSNASYKPEADEALRILAAQHVTSAKIVSVCQRLAYSQSKEAEPLLRAVIEKNEDKEARAWATITLGRYLHRQGENSKTAEAEKLFERVASDYAGVKGYRGTLGEAAKAELFELRNLAIGKVAPEIEGADVNGKQFKLSEHAGKVRVIDFWGDW